MKLIIKTTALLAIMTSVLSCSIKEDRTHCPCRLSMDITACSPYGEKVILAAWGTGRIFCETVAVSDYPETYDRGVPKGYVHAIACSALEESALSGRYILIPEGRQTDKVMARSELVDCRGETAHDKVTLHKQYATVHLNVDCPDGGAYPYSLAVKGNINGLDLVTLEPVEGPYSSALQANPDGTSWEFRLPRQKTGSKIELQVIHEGEVRDTLPLYRWIEATGYSWKETDLKDISITMDYARTHVTVIVQGWEGISLEIII